MSDDAAESLRRWLSRTETLISRAESTRTDWDRHLRPMLARQFEMATGQRRIKDHAALHATGRCCSVRSCGRGWTRRTSSRPAERRKPGPAGMRSTRFCNGWSGYDGEAWG